MKPFKYSGCKTKLLSLYRRPPQGTLRIVEPYLGTGAYGLSTELPCLGYETSTEVVSLWKWLQSTTQTELHELEFLLAEARSKEEKPDIREFKLDLGRQTYLRLNVASVITGQLKSWKAYPKHKLPIRDTIACLERMKDFEVVHATANNYVHRDGDMLFVDPPYVGTDGGYISNESKQDHGFLYRPQDTIRLISSTKNPVIFTYGNGAPDVFPEYEWAPVKKMKVPNIKKGGSVERTEWVSYINWP
jgi:site-specific DNA-adenine methylase